MELAYARDNRPTEAWSNGDNPSDEQTAHAMYKLVLVGELIVAR